MGRLAVDITGKVFGSWRVIRRAERESTKEAYWLCKCSCGGVAEVRGGKLRKGESTNCGCVQVAKVRERQPDITGQRFGKLEVLGLAEVAEGRSRWLCVCDCGNACEVVGDRLRGGHTVSCGCRKATVCVERSTTHGQASRNGRSPEYRTWLAMLSRALTGSTDKDGHYYYCVISWLIGVAAGRLAGSRDIAAGHP